MKKLYSYFSTTLILLFLISSGTYGQIKVGVGGGLISDGSTALLQGRVEIGPPSFHLSNSFNFVLEDRADWAIDIDGHYLIGVIDESIYLDLFPGLNLFKVNNDTDIGLNLGGTVRIETQANAIYIEPKYTVGTYDSFVITGGFIF